MGPLSRSRGRSLREARRVGFFCAGFAQRALTLALSRKRERGY